MRPMRHVLTHDEQSLLDLANVDPTRFKEVIKSMIKSLPQLDSHPSTSESDPSESCDCSLDCGEEKSKKVELVEPVDLIHCSTRRNSFRPLNENELHILWVKSGIAYPESDRGTWVDSIPWDDLRVSYEELSDGFTICLITLKPTYLSTSFLWRGVSRRSYHDRPNRIKGEALAFIRAITESRPVEIGG